MPRKRGSGPIKRDVNPEIADKMAELYAEALAVFFRKNRDVLSYRKFALIVANLHPGRRLYDPSTVATWIKYGQRPDDADTQKAIATAFGVLPGWLWYNAGSRYADQPHRMADFMPTTEGVVIARSHPKPAARRKRGRA